MRVGHYVVDGERGAFQFVHPRREPLAPDVRRVALSLIHHNYVQGDFEAFEVEVIELSAEQFTGPRGGIKLTDDRHPKTHVLPRSELADRKWLNEQANDVYALLMEISEE
ncbi:hypothetical protein RHWG_00018 [Rhodobacter phage RC1]|uniref:hypothetical protein n=1 Tax=Rhodobacter phage RC1 TaxID=754055 RepID=UPI0002C17FDC|nr:hypothetical protein RHWG_00018 [Rhodobacter phage RC1]AGH58039.1 hypothetical protein RHWG_00018 [Rhodobacter phage RC1]